MIISPIMFVTLVQGQSGGLIEYLAVTILVLREEIIKTVYLI